MTARIVQVRTGGKVSLVRKAIGGYLKRRGLVCCLLHPKLSSVLYEVTNGEAKKIQGLVLEKRTGLALDCTVTVT